MNKFKKGLNYLKEKGITSFFKRVKMNISFQLKSEAKSNKDGIYKLKLFRKNLVERKSNLKIAILANDCYQNAKFVEKYAKILNDLGCSVNYYYINNNVTYENEILPLSQNKSIKNFIEKDNDYIFVEENLNIEIDFKNKIIMKTNSTKQEIVEECLKIYKKNNDFDNNISIVVLNYNNDKIIQKCIDSLLMYNDYNYEIIVIDNQSSDGSYEKLQKEYKEKIILAQNNKNGCSSGRNLGISLATKEYILFLDSDQWVENHYWLNNYLEIYNDTIGAIGWTGGWFDKNGYSSQIVDNFPFRNMPPWGYYRKDIGYLGTGGMFVKKKVLEEVGMFDIKYDPTCYEDTDISLKIRNVGLELIYCPYLGIFHLPHQTTNSGSMEHEKLIKEKGNYFVKKWKKINPKLLKYRK